MYVWVATIQIITIFYLFCFYTKMAGQENDIAEQYASNNYSESMVILVIVFVIYMVVDRVLYTMHVFLK